jgi:hypothetical protein
VSDFVAHHLPVLGGYWQRPDVMLAAGGPIISAIQGASVANVSQ